MSSAKRYLLIALAFALALTIFAAFAPRAAHAFVATMVQVVNTAANPVAITGPVDASGSNVNVANQPTVNVGNMPTMNIANDVTSPLQVSDQYKARNAVQFHCDADFTPNHTWVQVQFGDGTNCSGHMEPGQRLVITQVSIRTSLLSNEVLTHVAFFVTQGGSSSVHEIIPNLIAKDNDYAYYGISQPTLMVSDSAIAITAYRVWSAGTTANDPLGTGVSITAGGYLIDCTTGCRE